MVCPDALLRESVGGGLVDSSGWVGTLGCKGVCLVYRFEGSGGGDGIEGIEPCGEFAPVLDRLW